MRAGLAIEQAALPVIPSPFASGAAVDALGVPGLIGKRPDEPLAVPFVPPVDLGVFLGHLLPLLLPGDFLFQ
jgi:hypothetical protein